MTEMVEMAPNVLLTLKMVLTETPRNTEQQNTRLVFLNSYFRRIIAETHFSRNHAKYNLCYICYTAYFLRQKMV